MEYARRDLLAGAAALMAVPVSVKVVATLAGPERGAIIARESFGTGDARIEIDRVLIFTVADDLLRECWVYDADPTLLDRFFATN